MPLSPSHITDFQKKILFWYRKNKRDLPWRDLPFDPVLKQRDPYKILVSEVMAQQTQISRVIPQYLTWIEHFPTLQRLADAPTRDVLLQWSGLGYNRRALNLQKAAQIIVEQLDGKFPKTYDELMGFPGIGKYTANALLCFAFNQQVAVVDTNVRKVILLEILKETDGTKETKGGNEKKGEFRIEEIAEQLLPKGKAYEWNQALMDYAGTFLKNEKIPLPKQSPFKASDRYYRGQVMKKLVRDHTASLQALALYFDEHNPIDAVRLEKVLTGLEKDGLITRSGKKITII